MEASKGKVILRLSIPDLILILDICLFKTLHSQISFFHQLALGLLSGVQQALQFGSMSSTGGSMVTSQFFHLSLELDLNLGQTGILSFGIFKLGIFLPELSIFFSELDLQLGNPFLGSLKFGGASSSS